MVDPDDDWRDPVERRDADERPDEGERRDEGEPAGADGVAADGATADGVAAGFDAFRGIDPRWAAASRIAGVLSLLVPAGMVAMAIAVGLPRLIGLSEGRLLAIAGPLFGLAFLWRLIYPTLALPRWRFRVDDRVLVVEYGVIVLTSILVPLSRIQHVDIQRGPFDRLFGIATLIVNTAGTAQDDVAVPGLLPEEARGLRDHIVHRSGLYADAAGLGDGV